MTINELVERSGPGDIDDNDFARLHGAVSNAFHEYDSGNMDMSYAEVDGQERKDKAMRGEAATRQPIGLPTELAGIVIQVAKMCGRLGIDLDVAISERLD